MHALPVALDVATFSSQQLRPERDTQCLLLRAMQSWKIWAHDTPSLHMA